MYELDSILPLTLATDLYSSHLRRILRLEHSIANDNITFTAVFIMDGSCAGKFVNYKFWTLQNLSNAARPQ